MSNSQNIIDVYLNSSLIANIALQEDEMYWEYSKDWQTNGYQISPYIFINRPSPPLNVKNFLRNMMPEGNLFDELLAYHQLSKFNTFGIMLALGLDTSGALVMLPNNIKYPTTSNFIKISLSEIAKRLDTRDKHSIIIWNDKPRLSVAGIQDKINIVINENDEIGFGEGLLCSTHILKFSKQNCPELIVNEYLSMKLAKCCNLSTADVKIIFFNKNPALLIKRFDRELISNLEVQRKHIIDGCQALNLPPEYKYERNFGSGRDVANIRDGASFPKIFEFCKQCINPAQTTMQILDWALFNLLIYNFDAHGKNISFYVTNDGISLAPFYDLLNIKMHSEFAQEMAMAYGDEFIVDEIKAYQLLEFSEACKIQKTFLAEKLTNMCKKLLNAMENIDAMLSDIKGYDEYIEQYKSTVTNHCKLMLTQAELLKNINL